MIFTTLAPIVIDEIHFESGPVVHGVLGGSGTYATIGARMFSKDCTSSIGWMANVGSDFPSSSEQSLESLNIALHLDRTNKCSTRSVLKYQKSSSGPSNFSYKTPPLPLSPGQLRNSPKHLNSRCFHLLGTSETIESMVEQILVHRTVLERPVIMWEPLASFCKPGNWQKCLNSVKLVDIFSPNHLELMLLSDTVKAEGYKFDAKSVEGLAEKILDSGVGPKEEGLLIVRAAEHGCLITSRNIKHTWVPAFYGNEQEKVVDPTGAGNAFLGAYGVGYINTGDPIYAAAMGSVAASFVLEQVGLPKLEDQNDVELWNGVSALDRLETYSSTRYKLKQK